MSSTSVREEATSVLDVPGRVPAPRLGSSLARAGIGFLVSATLLVIIMIALAALQGAAS